MNDEDLGGRTWARKKCANAVLAIAKSRQEHGIQPGWYLVPSPDALGDLVYLLLLDDWAPKHVRWAEDLDATLFGPSSESEAMQASALRRFRGPLAWTSF